MRSFTSHRRILILLGLYVCFVGYVFATTSQLPERVATHFDSSGQPNGWMTRSGHLLFTLGFGFVFPLFVVAICSLFRFMPDDLFNLPDRDYWLAPERRAATCAYFRDQSLWFACMAVVFVTGIHHLILRANSQTPPVLSMPLLLGLAGCFLAGVAVWAITLLRHFKRPN